MQRLKKGMKLYLCSKDPDDYEMPDHYGGEEELAECDHIILRRQRTDSDGTDWIVTLYGKDTPGCGFCIPVSCLDKWFENGVVALPNKRVLKKKTRLELLII